MYILHVMGTRQLLAKTKLLIFALVSKNCKEFITFSIERISYFGSTKTRIIFGFSIKIIQESFRVSKLK